VTSPTGRVSGFYAGAFTRLAAFVLDWFILVATFGLLVGAFQWLLRVFFAVDLEVGEVSYLVWLLALSGWAFVYMVVGMTISGRTVGKALLGLKVVTREGFPLGMGRAAARVVVMPLSFAVFGMGLLGIVLGRERRALHDVIAGTSVVYDWGDRPAEMPAPLTRWIERRGVTVIADPNQRPEVDAAHEAATEAGEGT
jgi:uncharacterized RDD family membrane protein YckC